MMARLRWFFPLLFLALLTSAAPIPARADSYDIVGGAAVNADGTLYVGSRWIRLYGVYIPSTGQHCSFVLSPAYCGSRAAVALNNRIQGFVSCRPVSRYRDGSMGAFCAVERTKFSAGVDLGAYLIERGLALAGPGAPFEYTALERIAQTRRSGLWGFTADTLLRP